MMIKLEGINYLAVVIAGLGTFIVGGVWYQALFGKLWKGLHGYSEEKLKQMYARRPPAVFFSGLIVSYLVLAMVIAVVTNSLGVSSASGGALLGFLLWIGPAAMVGMTGHLASDRHIGIYYIDVSYQLIYLVFMGALLGGWH